MNERQEKLLLAEYDQIRVEIGEKLREIRSLPKFAIVGSAAVWAWGLAHSDSGALPVIKYIPLSLTILIWMQNAAANNDLFRIGSYLARVERAFDLPSGLGWENRAKRRSWVQHWSTAFWLTLTLANVVGIIAVSQL